MTTEPTPEPQGRPKGVLLVVSAMSVSGLLSLLAVAPWTATWRISTDAFTSPQLWPYGVYLVAAIIAEVIYVPIRHGDADEELTFFEVLLIIGVLIFTPIAALIIPLMGFVVAELLLGRPVVKILFNLGSYALSGSALVLTYGLVAGDSPRFSALSVVGLLLGGMIFAFLNMLFLAIILRVDQGVSVREFLHEQWVLSIGMAVGNVGVGATAVALATTAPALVPFALLPAIALWYVYTSQAQRNDVIERNRWIVELSTLLATPAAAKNLVPRAGGALRHVFYADDIRIVDGATVFAAPAPGEELHAGRASASDKALALGVKNSVAQIPADQLPVGWHTGAMMSLELANNTEGAVLLGGTKHRTTLERVLPWARGPWQLGEVDKPVLQALAAALGSSLRASAHLTSLTEETAKLTAVVANATDGIAVAADDEQFTLWSPAMAETTGISAEVALGVTQPDEAQAHIVDQMQEIVARGTATDQEFAITRADKVVRELSMSVVWIDAADPANRSHVSQAILTLRDVTKQRQADRAKSDFIATISHELRTPITPIKGYAQLLSTKWDKMNDQKRIKVLDTISSRANHLSRLVDDLLLASNVSATGETKLEINTAVVSAQGLVDDTIAAFPDLAPRIEIQSEEVDLLCDRDRAIQCLGNLVGNAGKYSRPDSVIRVEMNVPDGQSWVEIAVIDQGRGIPADELEKVFDRFYRVEDPMTMTTGGSGLGLFISRQLARAMKGDITAQSEIDQGSIFTLRLPKKDAE